MDYKHDKIRSMKIIVTGGAGFIASHIVDAYIKDGHEVAIIDDLSSGKREFINPKAKFYKADIRKNEEIETIFKAERPDVVNHHAAQISVSSSVDDPFFDLEVNLVGLLNLATVGQKLGLKKIIFASSGGVVYGEANIIPTAENYSPLKPQSPYGVSKLASEHYLNYFYQNFQIPFIALRYSNVYGPRQNPHGEAGVVAIFTLKLLKGQVPIINGDGKQTRDYVYVEDVVDANRKALNSSEIGALNIGTTLETNVIEIFESIKKLVRSDILPTYGPARSGEQRRSSLDCSLAKKVLKWQSRTNLVSGLQKTVDYFQKYAKS